MLLMAKFIQMLLDLQWDYLPVNSLEIENAFNTLNLQNIIAQPSLP